MRDSIYWASECMAQGAGVIIEPISLPKEFLRAEINRLAIEPNYEKLVYSKKYDSSRIC